MEQIHHRYLKRPVEDDLRNRMVFIGGPRQVGKTTFAFTFLTEPSETHPAYLNWDDIRSRSALMKGELPPNQPLIILDEV